jgi:surface polysaccharide O-acyltransferase-like enzyme
MFLKYIHSFRAFAIISVVAAHCILLFDWRSNGWSYQLAQSLIPNCTVFFVFISGFLFQHLSHKFQYRRYLKSRWDNVLLPYVIVSMPMIAAQAVTGGGVFDPTYAHHWPTVTQNIGWSLLTGHHILMPFWFIPMIAIFYVLAPVFLWIDRDGRFYYLLPLLLTITVCVHRPSNLDHIWQSGVYFLPIYLFGMWFSRHRERLLAWHDRWLPVLLMAVVGLTWLDVGSQHAGYIRSAAMFSPEHGVVDTNGLLKLLLCGVILVILRRSSEKLHNIVRPVANASFGIYFLHMYFLKGIAHFLAPHTTSPGVGLWRYWLSIAVIATLCIGYPWFGKLVLGVFGRYLGERRVANTTWDTPRVGAQHPA